MGFIEDKKETVDSVALFEVLGNLPKARSTSSLSSVVSKSKNLLPYLVDLLSLTCKDNSKKGTDVNANSIKFGLGKGSKCEATRILTSILVQFFPSLLEILKEGLIKAIKAGLFCGSNFNLPTVNNIPGAVVVKIRVDLKNIDFNKMLQTSPLEQIGSTLYGKNPLTDLNWFLNDLIQNGGQQTWKGIVTFSYTPGNEYMEIEIEPAYPTSGGGGNTKTFEDFIKDFTESTDLITKEQFLANLTNGITGYVLANASLDQILASEKVSKLQDKINNSDPCKEDYEVDDSYFTFSNEEMMEMEIIANQKAKGIRELNLGCGLVQASASPNLVKGIFDEIRNAPPYEATKVIENSINALNDNLTENVDDKDKDIAKLSLNAKFIEQIPKILTNIILEPKLVVLYQLCAKLVNGPLNAGTPDINPSVTATNSFDYAKATKVFFEFVARESLAALLEIVFKQVKKEIMLLVGQTAAKIAKDQSKLRLKQLTFLTGGIVEGALAKVPTPDVSKFT